MRVRTISGVAAALAFVLSVSSASPETERFEFSRVAMGTAFRIVLYADGQDQAKQAADAAFARILGLNQVLSDWEKDSELSRLIRENAGEAHPVSPDLFAVLEAALQFAEISGGAFDITAGPLIALWRKSLQTRVLPAAADLDAARRRVGFRNIVLDPEKRTVKLTVQGMQIDLGGIAKGYAVDEALRVLHRHGIENALVDGGGDVGALVPPPGEDSWKVQVETPDQVEEISVLRLSRRAVATSGDAYQSAEIDGQRYSHIVDPRTGWALHNSAQVSVVAPSAIEADALATLLSVLSPTEGIALVETRAQTCARIVQDTPEGLRAVESECFRELLEP